MEYAVIIGIVILVIYLSSNKQNNQNNNTATQKKKTDQELMAEKDEQITKLKNELKKYKKYKPVIDQFEKVNSETIVKEA